MIVNTTCNPCHVFLDLLSPEMMMFFNNNELNLTSNKTFIKQAQITTGKRIKTDLKIAVEIIA